MNEKDIVGDLVPFVEKNYRTVANRENRAIAGLSMGASITANVGLKRLDVFASVGLLSSGMFGGNGNNPPAGSSVLERSLPGFLADPAATNKKLRVFFFSCGTEDPRITQLTKVSGRVAQPQDQFHVQDLPGRARVEGLAPFAGRSGADVVPVGGRHRCAILLRSRLAATGSLLLLPQTSPEGNMMNHKIKLVLAIAISACAFTSPGPRGPRRWPRRPHPPGPVNSDKFRTVFIRFVQAMMGCFTSRLTPGRMRASH